MTVTVTQVSEQTKKIFMNVINKEYSIFKYRMLANCPRAIYDSCNIIRFYECVREYFLYNENMDLRIIDVMYGEDNIISLLYHYYMQHEECGVGTWEEIDEMIDMYINNKAVCKQ